MKTNQSKQNHSELGLKILSDINKGIVDTFNQVYANSEMLTTDDVKAIATEYKSASNMINDIFLSKQEKTTKPKESNQEKHTQTKLDLEFER